MANQNDLTDRQEAGERLERLMIEFLMQYRPARDLKVGEVLQIASSARSMAFNEFSKTTA